MNTSLRTLAPAALAALLALAGCKTTPQSDTAAAAPGSQESQAAAGSAPAAPPDGGGSAAAGEAAPASASRVEFYLGQTEPGQDMAEVTLPDGKLYLQPQPVLTRSDLAEAAAVVDRQGNHYVGLSFTELGAHRLSEVTRDHVGSLLALVIDRELVAAPRIAEPLSRGVLMFGTPNAESAAQIAAAIRGDQPPAGAAPGASSPPQPSAPDSSMPESAAPGSSMPGSSMPGSSMPGTLPPAGSSPAAP